MPDNILQTIKTRTEIIPELSYQLLQDKEFINKVYKITDLPTLSDEEQTHVRNEIVLTLLFFSPVQLLSNNIADGTSVTENQAKEIVKQVMLILPDAVQKDLTEASHDMIKNLPDSPEKKELMKKVELAENASLLTQPVAQTTDALDDMEEQHDILPMRTMKGDIQRIHGYGAYREQFPADTADEENEPIIKSTQDAVLQKESLVETPKVAE